MPVFCQNVMICFFFFMPAAASAWCEPSCGSGKARPYLGDCLLFLEFHGDGKQRADRTECCQKGHSKHPQVKLGGYIVGRELNTCRHLRCIVRGISNVLYKASRVCCIRHFNFVQGVSGMYCTRHLKCVFYKVSPVCVAQGIRSVLYKASQVSLCVLYKAVIGGISLVV